MVNRVTLIGNLGQDPEIRTLDSGSKVAQFSIATSESWKDKNGEKQSETTWHNIVIWGKLADVVERYVKKGDKLYLEGKIKLRTWEDQEGNKRYATDIVCNVMQMLGGVKGSTSANNAQDQSSQGAEPDDLPF